MASASIPRKHQPDGFSRQLPEGYDSPSLAAIKEAFGLHGWMAFLDLANIQYRATGKLSLVSQVNYDASVDLNDNGELTIMFWLPDGETVEVAVPPDFPGLDVSSIQDLIPEPPMPILHLVDPNNAIWVPVVLF
jgi:hypothetical protein